LLIFGCDAGKQGALAVLDTNNSESIEIHPLPYTEDGEFDAFCFCSKLHNFWYEDVCSDDFPLFIIEYTFQPIPFVRQTGEMIGAAKCLNCRVCVVPVSTWKKDILGMKTNDKQVSIDYALKRWPSCNFMKTEKSRKPWHDACEAACLAEWGRLYLCDGDIK